MIVLGTCCYISDYRNFNSLDVISRVNLFDDYWSHQNVDFKTIIAISSKETISLDIESVKVPYYNKFNLSYLINNGFKQIKNNYNNFYLQLAGIDCIPSSKNHFEICLEEIKHNDILVFSMFRIPIKYEEICNLTYEEFLDKAKTIYVNKNKKPTECIIFMKENIMSIVGGFDEAYQIWGYEDKDFLLEAKRKKLKIKHINSPLYHLDHPRPGMHSFDFKINRYLYGLKVRNKRTKSDVWGEDKPSVDENYRKIIGNKIVNLL